MSPTPEYVALQSQYQTLQSQYQQVRQGLNQSLAQNVKLQQSLQAAQNAIAHAESTTDDLKNRETLSQNIVTLLAIISVTLVLVGVYIRRTNRN
jgi:chromosome segregation ATPase